jgi:hypothetical protein
MEYVNSGICAFVVFMLDLFFSFFVYVLNLVLKIMEIVDRYVVNGNITFKKKIEHVNSNFDEWQHGSIQSVVSRLGRPEMEHMYQ